jgi:hypothetical protein
MSSNNWLKWAALMSIFKPVLPFNSESVGISNLPWEMSLYPPKNAKS